MRNFYQVGHYALFCVVNKPGQALSADGQGAAITWFVSTIKPDFTDPFSELIKSMGLVKLGRSLLGWRSQDYAEAFYASVQERDGLRVGIGLTRLPCDPSNQAKVLVLIRKILAGAAKNAGVPVATIEAEASGLYVAWNEEQRTHVLLVNPEVATGREALHRNPRAFGVGNARLYVTNSGYVMYGYRVRAYNTAQAIAIAVDLNRKLTQR